jgi:hypothetical protein
MYSVQIFKCFKFLGPFQRILRLNASCDVSFKNVEFSQQRQLITFRECFVTIIANFILVDVQEFDFAHRSNGNRPRSLIFDLILFYVEILNVS